MEFALQISGKPVAWMRRVPIGRGKAFSPKRMVDYKTRIQVEFAQHYRNCKPLEGPVEVAILIDWPIPKSFSKKKRGDALKYELRPTTKPDIDNIAKIVCDALNTIAYQDDAQIVYLSVSKRYSEQAALYITITGGADAKEGQYSKADQVTP